jgi:hypothetical protein
MPSINNFLKGFSDGLPGLKDFQHASRLYLDDNFKLLPKQKFLFHVVFTIDNTIPARPFTNNERLELNMLVKSCELPKYDMNLEERLQYNKKVYVGTRIKYNPVNIVFHDDHADTVNAFWKAYYEYNIADSQSINSTGIVDIAKDDMYHDKNRKVVTQFGMDNAQKRGKPFLKAVQIFALHKKTFTGFTLVNPIIGSFSHDNLDQTDGGGLMTNTMQLFYETVIYTAGKVDGVSVPGFATLHYDKEPSPLSVLGRGTTSIFGPGGIVDGVGSVIGNVREGNYFGAVLGAINTYNNAKKIKAKEAVKEELKGIVKEGVIDIGRQAGTITNPVGSFSIGTVAVAGAAAAVLAGSKSLSNGQNPNNRVISTPVLNTRLYLSPTESFNLVQSNLVARDKVAAGIYYKQVGSRKGLTISQSEVEYTAATNDVKKIYRSRALTDTTKLVSDGFIKINRAGNEVAIVAERAGL